MLKSGHRVVPVTGKEAQKQFDEFLGNRVGTIRLQPDGWFFTLPYVEFADKIYDFKFKPTDVVIMTYPKCGTTWMQEIVWTLMHNRKLDNPKAVLPINVRCPFVESDFLLKSDQENILAESLIEMFEKMLPGRNPEDGISLQMAELADDPRIIKTHLPLSLVSPSLLDTCKVVYVVRNPKDVLISYFHHSRLFKGHNFVGTLDSFTDHFINDTTIFGPFWAHVREAWDKRFHPNMLICYYEDMKTDTKNTYVNLSKFLDLNITDEEINNIIDYTSFEAMKKRNNVFNPEDMQKLMNHQILKEEGGFFRKGKSEDWKNKLNEEQVKRVDEWTKQNTKSFEGDFKYKSA